MKSVTISSKYQIVIPAAIRKKYDVKPGYKVVFIPYERSVRLVIVPPIEQAEGFLAGIDTDPQREEQNKER